MTAHIHTMIRTSTVWHCSMCGFPAFITMKEVHA
jgi:hypothetical protein